MTEEGGFFVTGYLFPLGADPAQEIAQRVREAAKLSPASELSVGPVTKSIYPQFLISALATNEGGSKQTALAYITRGRKIGIWGSVMPSQKAVMQAIATRNQPSVGPANAPVTIVEYLDLQCPACAQFHQFLENDCLRKYGGKVRLIFKEFPLVHHDWATPAAVANECGYQIARLSFLSYRTLIFANQGTLNASNARDQLLSFGEQVGIDRAKLSACLDSKASLPRVDACRQEAEMLGVRKTPTSFVNGRIVEGPVPPESFYRVVDAALTATESPAARPAAHRKTGN